MPVGRLVTVPGPDFATLSVYVAILVAAIPKLAIAVIVRLLAIVQAAVPVHAPLQPVKVELVAGAAASLTTVPAEYVAEHVGPQSIPAGILVTMPVPVPAVPTVTTSELEGAVPHASLE